MDEDDILETFKTKRERNKEANARHQRDFRLRHNAKQFNVVFRDSEQLAEIQNRLRADKVTNKEFIIKSFERYKKEGGFKD